MEEKIFITMEEYKELLIIKGKYEELKSLQRTEIKPNWNYRGLTTTYDDSNSILLCHSANKQREE